MKVTLFDLWEALHTSFWFIPALMTVAAIGLSYGLVAVDSALREARVDEIEPLWTGGAEAARQLLATIAQSMITVAGVVFSITIVVLTLASSQFGPRLLRNFMRDRGNQLVLGTFVATFTYSLLVLRAIRGADGGEFVPHVSITVGIGLALISVGVLIYFIHHVSAAIQAPSVIDSVATELDQSIDRLFPERLGQSVAQPNSHEENIPPDFDRRACSIPASQSGYLQFIEIDRLMQLAVDEDLFLRLEYRPGHFIVEGSYLAKVWPGEKIDEHLSQRIVAAFNLGIQRTPTQDVEFAIDQLVEVAVLALSPSMNDPFTAMNCIDQLGVALCRLAEREMPSPYRYDSDKKLRVVAPAVTFAGVLDAGFNQIRQYGRSSAPVTIRLLETLAILAARARREGDLHAIAQQAEFIQRGSLTLPEERDRKDATRRYLAVCEALQKNGFTDGLQLKFDPRNTGRRLKEGT